MPYIKTSCGDIYQKRCELTYPIVKYEKQTIAVDDDRATRKWTTETLDAFQTPQKEKINIGKREELLLKFFRLKAAKEIIDELMFDTLLEESAKCLSEYFNNYCNRYFIPTLEKSEFNKELLKRNPLYGDNLISIAKEHFDKKILKVPADYRNEKRPFARRSVFTTPPELALEEPLNGF